MRLYICGAFILLILAHIEAIRDTSRSRSSSGSRGSSGSRSSSSSSSSWGSSRKSSSYPTQSFGSSGSSSSSSSRTLSSATPRKSLGTKIKDKLGFGSRKTSSGSSTASKTGWAAGSSGSGYAKQSFGPGTNTAPKQTYVPQKPAVNTGSYPTQGQPARTNYNQGVGAGGVAGGFGGGHVGGGGFVAPRPVQNNMNTHQAPPSSSGGFVNPSSTGHQAPPSSSGGFANPSSSGQGGYNSNYGQRNNYNTGSSPNTGSNYNTGQNYNTGSSYNQGNSNNYGSAGMGGAGMGGMLGARQNFGSYSNGQQTYGARAPGYGTSWGTNFNGGVGQYDSGKKGFSKKALGLGVGAGFLGGAALGVGGTMATYGAIHKYKEFQSMMHERDHYQHQGSSMMDTGRNNNWNNGYQDDYYRKYYIGNECYEGCPENSHCEYSFCECRYGFTKKFGRCQSEWGGNQLEQQEQFRPNTFDPFKSCSTGTECMNMDMNLICNKDLTTQGDVGKCECRRDMKWNSEAMECQVYLDVDCSKFTYDTAPSVAVKAAVEQAQKELNDMPMIGEGVMLNKTETPQETIDKSLLKQMDVKTSSEDDLLEAYCRDIDAYSFDLNQQNVQMTQNRQAPMYTQPQTNAKQEYPDPDRPAQCEEVPADLCGAAYQTKDCSSGWKLDFPKGEEMRFKWGTPFYAYKNRIELIGVRPGCSLTVFEKNNFTGDTITITGDGEFNKWVSLADDAQSKHLNNQIKSVKCICN